MLTNTKIKNSLYDIIENNKISTLFQPIVCLKTGEVKGYEALSRGPENNILTSPLKLINLAKDYFILDKLEMSFRTSAIKSAKMNNITNEIFLNIEPTVLESEYFPWNFTKFIVERHGLEPSQITLEITERSNYDNIGNFKKTIERYKLLGYKIAIDDAGTGNSNMLSITKINPDYIKIDMEIIRNIHKDSLKEAIVKSYIKLASLINATLVAEGIETAEELDKLIDLGVDAGQGFFLKKPEKHLTKLPEEALSLICKKKSIRDEEKNTTNKKIGEIAQTLTSFNENVSSITIKKYLDENNYEGVCIVNNKNVKGLVMKKELDNILSKQYGYAIFANRPICKLKNSNYIIVDYNETISHVSKLASKRPKKLQYDIIIITKNKQYYGIVTIIDLLYHSINIEKTLALNLNPLTGLPGNKQINKAIENCIKTNCIYSALYLDLDNFKHFNDLYGFEKGDEIIKKTAEIIKNVLNRYKYVQSFLGHIGGDDFFILLKSSKKISSQISMAIITEFNKKSNYKNLSLTIAGIIGNLNIFSSATDMSSYLSNVKSEAKKIKGSVYKVKYTNRKIISG